MCFLFLDKEQWLTIPEIELESLNEAFETLEGADAELDTIEGSDKEANAPVALLTLITLLEDYMCTGDPSSHASTTGRPPEKNNRSEWIWRF